MLPTGVDAGARGPSSVRREYPAPSGVGGARPCLHSNGGLYQLGARISFAAQSMTELPRQECPRLQDIWAATPVGY